MLCVKAGQKVSLLPKTQIQWHVHRHKHTVPWVTKESQSGCKNLAMVHWFYHTFVFLSNTLTHTYELTFTSYDNTWKLFIIWQMMMLIFFFNDRKVNIRLYEGYSHSVYTCLTLRTHNIFVLELTTHKKLFKKQSCPLYSLVFFNIDI